MVVTRPASLTGAKSAIDELLRAVDQAASRFRDDSELSRLNAAPGTEVVVSPLLSRRLAAALRGARITGGAVDPTVGTAIRLVGYEADFTQVPSDLGATAKALASDMAAAAALRAIGEGGVLVSLGWDIAVAGNPPPDGLPIQAGEDSGAPIQRGGETISIRSGGIATSSTTVRRWTRGGVVLHHIIDPATGLPTTGQWRTATVVAGTCVDANIASTAAIVMGAEAIGWLEANRLPARLVDCEGTVQRVSGWPTP